MLKGIQEYLQQKTNMKVLYGAHDKLLDVQTEEQFFEPRYSALVGALLLGSDYRDEHQDLLVKEPGLFEKLKNQTGQLFTEEQLS